MPQISRTYLTDQVYEATRKRIMDHALKPGSRLNEATLALEFGVSRMPAREALRRLVAEGLMEVRGDRGTYVAEMSARDARDVYLLRESLECAAVVLAAERRTGVDLARMHKALVAMTAAAARGASAGMIRSAFTFHDALKASAHSPILTLLLDQITAHARRYRELTLGKAERHQQVLEDHTALLEAIKAQDGRLASGLIRAHVRKAYATVELELDHEQREAESSQNRGRARRGSGS